MNNSLLSRFLQTVAAFVLVVAGLKAASSIIVPFLLAAFIAALCTPLLVFLRGLRIGTPFAVLIVMALLLFGLWTLLTFTGNSLIEFSNKAASYQGRLEEMSREWFVYARDRGITVTQEHIDSLFNAGNVMRMVTNSLTHLQKLLTSTFLILLTVVFMLLEVAGFPNKIKAAFGNDHPSLRGISEFTKSLNRYMLLKTIISAVTGMLVYCLALIMRLDFAGLWGTLAFFLNFVPNIGSIIAAIPATLLALVQYGTVAGIIVALGYLSINVTIGNLVEPRVMGRGLGLSTLVVFMSLIFWGWVLGPTGMLLSVPLTMFVKIAMESNRDTQWLAILLGPDPGPDAALASASSQAETSPASVSDSAAASDTSADR